MLSNKYYPDSRDSLESNGSSLMVALFSASELAVGSCDVASSELKRKSSKMIIL